MWMLLAVVALVIMFMVWVRSDRNQTELPAHGEPRPAAASQIVATKASQNPTISYRITRWDLFANHMTLWMRNRILQVFLALFLAWELWIVLSHDLGYATPLQLAFRVLGALAFYGVLLVGALLLVGLSMSFLLKQRGVVCEHILEITDEGLVESTELNRTLHKWSSIGRIMNIFGYLFVYVGDQTSHQIPRRSIPPTEIASFERELRARAAAAGSSETLQPR